MLFHFKLFIFALTFESYIATSNKKHDIKKIDNLFRIETSSDLDYYKQNYEIIILGVFTSLSSPNAEIFQKSAQSDKSSNNKYAITVSSEVYNKIGISPDSITVLNKFNEEKSVMPLNLDPLTLKDFVNKNSYTLVHEFTQENSEEIFASPIKVLNYFDHFIHYLLISLYIRILFYVSQRKEPQNIKIQLKH